MTGLRPLGSGSGAPLVLAHANGFTPECYLPLRSGLPQEAALFALDDRALWAGRAPNRESWRSGARDMIAALEAAQLGPVTLLGHSMGASVSLLAAAARPDLFARLILMEPALLAPWKMGFLALQPRFLRARQEPARSTAKKPGHWPDFATALDWHRQDRTFRRVSDATLAPLVRALTEEHAAGIALRFPRAWEAHYYTAAANVLPAIRRLKVPTTFILGRPSFFFDPRLQNRVFAHLPDSQVIRFAQHGHLLPLEAPEDTARALAQLF